MDVIYLEFVYVILIVLKVRKGSDLCLASLEFMHNNIFFEDFFYYSPHVATKFETLFFFIRIRQLFIS
jgi:hypothetical protein